MLVQNRRDIARERYCLGCAACLRQQKQVGQLFKLRADFQSALSRRADPREAGWKPAGRMKSCPTILENHCELLLWSLVSLDLVHHVAEWLPLGEARHVV